MLKALLAQALLTGLFVVALALILSGCDRLPTDASPEPEVPAALDPDSPHFDPEALRAANAKSYETHKDGGPLYKAIREGLQTRLENENREIMRSLIKGCTANPSLGAQVHKLGVRLALDPATCKQHAELATILINNVVAQRHEIAKGDPIMESRIRREGEDQSRSLLKRMCSRFGLTYGKRSDLPAQYR